MKRRFLVIVSLMGLGLLESGISSASCSMAWEQEFQALLRSSRVGSLPTASAVCVECTKRSFLDVLGLRRTRDDLEAIHESVATTSGRVSQACVKQSLAEFPQNARYLSCGRKPESTRPPCVTDAYVSLMTQAFNEVARCFDIPPQRWLPELSHESGLHLNVQSPTGCTGAGQLCSIAVEHVVGEDLISKYIDPNRRECQERLQSVKPLRASLSACERVEPPKNPWLNLMMAAAMLRENRDRSFSLFTRTNLKFSSGDQRERARIAVRRLMYNAGPSGAGSILRAVKARFGASKVFTYDQFIKGIESVSLRQTRLGGVGRREELSSYIRKIDKKSQELQACR